MKHKLFFILFIFCYNNLLFAQSISYSYDSLGRITQVIYPDSSSITYAYDNAGNRISVRVHDPCSTKPRPVISPSGPFKFCLGDSIILTSSPALKYKWSTGINDTLRTVTIFVSDSVSVAVLDTFQCNLVSDTVVVAVDTPAGAITGKDSVCAGSVITLSDSGRGGSWSSSDISIATVNPASGAAGSSVNVTGVTPGTAMITYTLSNSCGTTSRSATVFVNTTATAITGDDSVCAGSITTLSDSIAGGSWSTSDTSIATVDPASGGAGSSVSVTGLFEGTAMITYTLSNSCGISNSSAVVSVNTTAGTITGEDFVCEGTIITLSDSTIGGSWSSSNAGIATVDSLGNIGGMAQGLDTITYSVTNSCGTTAASLGIMVSSNDIWTGAVSSTWRTGSNWSCGIMPTASMSAIIPGGVSMMPVIDSSLSYIIDSINIASGDTVTINSLSSLTIAGTVVNEGVVSGAGTLTIAGTAVQVFKGNGSINNLVFNNSAGASINTGDTTYITGTLTMEAGTLITHGGLTLVSNASGTARIGTITGGSISGNVNVQQYITGGRRAYRFWAHPFSTSIPLSQIEKYIDITGSGGAINGFTTTATNNPSCEWYNPIVGNSAKASDPGWTWFTNANGKGANAFKPKEGINLFIRGKKSQGLTLCSSCYTPLPVTITMTGPVNQGTVNDTLVSGLHSSYNMVANPYPSPVDIGTVVNNAKIAGKIAGVAFFVWNPYLATGGAFEAKTISSTPYYLEGNASFQVRTEASGKVITFSESNKSTVDSETLLRIEDGYVSLFIYDGDYTIWDKFYLSFNDNATDNYDDDYDAGKPVNPDLNFYSISADSEYLNIDARPYIENKIIPLGITTEEQQQYIFRVENVVLPVNGQLYLHDKYMKKYERLEQGTEYKFRITADAASQGNERFELGLGEIPGNAGVIKTGENGLKVRVVPNPAKDIVTVSFEAPDVQNTTIRLLDVSGVTIVMMNLGMKQNGNVELPVDRLASGVYMIELASGENKVTQKLIKE